MRGINSSISTEPTVAVVRCGDYEQVKVYDSVEKLFGLLGGVENFVKAGDSVLVKPNFIVPRAADLAVQTDPSIIIALVRMLKDFSCKPFVADSPAWNSISSCVNAIGLEEPLRRMGVPFMALDKPVKCNIDGTTVGISKTALEADKVINLPNLKAHQQLGATFAIKNMFGCVSGKRKAYWHFAKGKDVEAFCRMLVGIYKRLNPALTIVDGIVGMEGQGPISGRAKPVGFIIGSSDPLACEYMCCELVQFDPAELPLIQAAGRMDYGCSSLNEVTIVGDDYSDNICADFLPAELTPLDFTFTRLCKSIVKQIGLLITASLNRKSGKRETIER